MASYEVVVEQTGERFTASDDSPVLVSALKAGVEMPRSCRSGTCRTCMRQLASGTVMYRMAWPGLLPEEKEEGWILPCVAYPASDLRLRGAGQRQWWEAGVQGSG